MKCEWVGSTAADGKRGGGKERRGGKVSAQEGEGVGKERGERPANHPSFVADAACRGA